MTKQRTSNKMRLLRRYALRNDNERMSLRAKRSNLMDHTEQDHFILLEALRNNGYILILVIMAILLIGAVIFVLTEGANNMLFQSDTAYLEAVERNLIASGLTWAKQNIKGDKEEVFYKTIGLDVTDLNIPDANLSVVIGPGRDKEVEVEVSTSCSRGRRTLRHQDRYKIEISHKSQSNETLI